MPNLNDVKTLKTLMARNKQLSDAGRGANILQLRKIVEEKDDVIHEILRILCTDAAGRISNG